MNVKFRMLRVGNMEGKTWLQELLMTILATSISIVLTFGTAALIDKRHQTKNRKQAAMMVISDIYSIIDNMKRADSLAFRPNQSLLAQFETIPRDSVLLLNTDEAALPYFNAMVQEWIYTRDKTAENIFSRDISTWHDVGNFKFIKNVGLCYSIIEDLEHRLAIQNERRANNYQLFAQRNDWKNLTNGETLITIYEMKEVQIYIQDYTMFILYLEKRINDLEALNKRNMEIMNINYDELQKFMNVTLQNRSH